MFKLDELLPNPPMKDDLGVKLGTDAIGSPKVLFVSEPSVTLTSDDSTRCFMNSLPKFLLITD